MKRYITQINLNGIRYAGPEILAIGWDEAQAACNIAWPGALVIGELIEIIEL